MWNFETYATNWQLSMRKHTSRSPLLWQVCQRSNEQLITTNFASATKPRKFSTLGKMDISLKNNVHGWGGGRKIPFETTVERVDRIEKGLTMSHFVARLKGRNSFGSIFWNGKKGGNTIGKVPLSTLACNFVSSTHSKPGQRDDLFFRFYVFNII